jgi:hypothetical protein
VQAQISNYLSLIRSKMTHSYQESDGRAPIERGSGRAAMRVCPVAPTELTPVNRSRSRARAARIVARVRVGSRHTLGVSRTPIWSLNVREWSDNRDRKPQVGWCDGRCFARPLRVEIFSRKI